VLADLGKVQFPAAYKDDLVKAYRAKWALASSDPFSPQWLCLFLLGEKRWRLLLKRGESLFPASLASIGGCVLGVRLLFILCCCVTSGGHYHFDNVDGPRVQAERDAAAHAVRRPHPHLRVQVSPIRCARRQLMSARVLFSS
jgi:hypothetical protein